MKRDEHTDYPIISAMIKKEILQGIDGGLRREVERLYQERLDLIQAHDAGIDVLKSFQKLFDETVAIMAIAEKMAVLLRDQVSIFAGGGLGDEVDELVNQWTEKVWDKGKK